MDDFTDYFLRQEYTKIAFFVGAYRFWHFRLAHTPQVTLRPVWALFEVHYTFCVLSRPSLIIIERSKTIYHQKNMISYRRVEARDEP
jgi:hypothetical protein